MLCQIIFKKRQWKTLWKSSGQRDFRTASFRSRRVPYEPPLASFLAAPDQPNFPDDTLFAVGVLSVARACGRAKVPDTPYFYKMLILMELMADVLCFEAVSQVFILMELRLKRRVADARRVRVDLLRVFGRGVT